ncbi:STAS domain-containing protein [Streptomyces sp. NPDC057403]|uniref:STAS domain-containing protein n=1 Tax=Streptomyces sp. NPDC057403 TaxID=3346119 RepID=UPI00368183A5
MTSRSPLTVLPVTDRAAIVCLTGTLDADACADLARELGRHLDDAARRGKRLVLDVSGVPLVSAEARRSLRHATAHLAREPVPVVGAAPPVREALEHARLPGIRLYGTLAEALTEPPRPAPRSGHPPDEARDLYGETRDLYGEVFGLRAKARTSGLIGVAQGMLVVRYGLPGPAAAFALLRRASQHLNVPLRILASAVVTVPPPRAATEWFPGRAPHAPPDSPFLRAYGGDVTDRRQVLAAALREAIALSAADAAEVHLTDPAQDDALFLEQHQGLDAAYWDQVALVAHPPQVCARAQRQRAAVTVADVAADPALSVHPAGLALLKAGSHAVHSRPLLTPDAYCTGTLTLHRSRPGAWLTDAQLDELGALSVDLAAWRSWYRRTVVLDALEYLHRHR